MFSELALAERSPHTPDRVGLVRIPPPEVHWDVLSMSRYKEA